MVNQTVKTAPDRPSASGMPITETGSLVPRAQRFYCPGCREWHETPRLLDAIKTEAERLEIEKEIKRQ